ncbi:MAG: hypothetical protein OXH68_21135 [Gammaproteobacteria bacterium]|nr:hypothetical protein [Gammaproteobacteria bacterium]
MSGLATREVLRRQFEVFGEADYARLAAISNGHVYNLRASATYRAARTAWTKTKGSAVSIGLRQASEPEGMPGHVRVDTVNQGDRDGVKGIYLVDEVTQFEFVGAVVGISGASSCRCSRACCGPSRSRSSASTPTTAASTSTTASPRYSTSCAVERFTKSRVRRSNDNALVEGKNANVARKWFGHDPHPAALRARGQPGRLRSAFAQGIRRKYLAGDVMTPTTGSARCPAPRGSSSPASTSPCPTRSPPAERRFAGSTSAQPFAEDAGTPRTRRRPRRRG